MYNVKPIHADSKEGRGESNVWSSSHLPPGDLGRSSDLTNSEGPTPVDQTSRPYGTQVPSLRRIFSGSTSFTTPRTSRTPDCCTRKSSIDRSSNFYLAAFIEIMNILPLSSDSLHIASIRRRTMIVFHLPAQPTPTKETKKKNQPAGTITSSCLACIRRLHVPL